MLMSPDWDQSAESAFSHDRDHGQRAWASCSPLGSGMVMVSCEVTVLT